MFCVIYKFSDKNCKVIVKDCKVRYFRLPVVKKDVDTKTLEISKERRRIWLTKITRPSDNLSKAQLLEVNSTTRICGKHFLIVGAVMSMSNFYSIILIVPLFSEPITVSCSNTVSLLTGSIASQPSQTC